MALAQHGAGDPRFFGKTGPHGLAAGADVKAVADAKAGADVAGSPAQPVREFFRGVTTLRRLARKPAASASRPE